MKRVLAALLVSLGMSAVAMPAQAAPAGRIAVERDDGLDWRGARLEPSREALRNDERFRRQGGDDWRRDIPRLGEVRDVLPERRIARILRRSGFVGIEDIRLRRDRYVVTAVRANGAVFRLALDAGDGDILGSERLGWTRSTERRDVERFGEKDRRATGPAGRLESSR